MNTRTRLRHIARLIRVSHAALLIAACSDERPAGRVASTNGEAATARSASAISRGLQDENGTLDVGSWNIEWFGDPSNGPGNESLQLANATAMLTRADVDVWGLAEIVGETEWSRLVAAMRGYTGVLASDRIVADGRRYYAPTEQKLAVLFRSATMSMRDARVILTAYDHDFAGRPPLEVRLRDRSSPERELVVIVVHMKARNDRTSVERRARAADALKQYLDRTYPDTEVIVVGDWNDGLDRSITPGSASPYAAFVRDGARYRFTSQVLAERGESSTAGYGTMVDHHLVTNELADREVPSSVQVLRPGSAGRNFRSTTSDHFPVVSHFRLLPP